MAKFGRFFQIFCFQFLPQNSKFMLQKLCLVIAFALLAVACSPKSEKGKWTEKDKETFKKSCLDEYDKAKEDERKALKALGIGDKADFSQMCDCLLKNAEPMYLPDEINKNKEEQDKLSQKCFGELLGEKGAWKPKFKSMIQGFMEDDAKESFEKASEEEKELYKSFVECTIGKLEKEMDPKEFFNADKKNEILSNAFHKAGEECGIELHLGMELLKAIMSQNIDTE